MSAGGPAPGEMTAAVPAGICGSIRRRMPATSPPSVTSARAAAIRPCSHADRIWPRVAQRASISARSSSVTLAQTVFRFPSGVCFRGTMPVYRYVSAGSSGILLRMNTRPTRRQMQWYDWYFGTLALILAVIVTLEVLMVTGTWNGNIG